MYDPGVAFVFWSWADYASVVCQGEVEGIDLFLCRGVLGVKRQFVLWHVVGDFWVL